MKCLKCDKEAIWGNYCADHAAETGGILANIIRDLNAEICPPVPVDDSPASIDEKPDKGSKGGIPK